MGQLPLPPATVPPGPDSPCSRQDHSPPGRGGGSEGDRHQGHLGSPSESPPLSTHWGPYWLPGEVRPCQAPCPSGSLSLKHSSAPLCLSPCVSGLLSVSLCLLVSHTPHKASLCPLPPSLSALPPLTGLTRTPPSSDGKRGGVEGLPGLNLVLRPLAGLLRGRALLLSEPWYPWGPKRTVRGSPAVTLGTWEPLVITAVD